MKMKSIIVSLLHIKSLGLDDSSKEKQPQKRGPNRVLLSVSNVHGCEHVEYIHSKRPLFQVESKVENAAAEKSRQLFHVQKNTTVLLPPTFFLKVKEQACADAPDNRISRKHAHMHERVYLNCPIRTSDMNPEHVNLTEDVQEIVPSQVRVAEQEPTNVTPQLETETVPLEEAGQFDDADEDLLIPPTTHKDIMEEQREKLFPSPANPESTEEPLKDGRDPYVVALTPPTFHFRYDDIAEDMPYWDKNPDQENIPYVHVPPQIQRLYNTWIETHDFPDDAARAIIERERQVDDVLNRAERRTWVHEWSRRRVRFRQNAALLIAKAL